MITAPVLELQAVAERKVSGSRRKHDTLCGTCLTVAQTPVRRNPFRRALVVGMLREPYLSLQVPASIQEVFVTLRMTVLTKSS